MDFLTDWKDIIYVGILALILYKLIYFYTVTVKQYPPGPTPLPLIGNLHLIIPRVGKKHFHEIFQEIGTEYGPLFTVWFGFIPIIIVQDPESVMEVLKSKTFAGKPYVGFEKEFLSKPGSEFIFFEDPNPGWEATRRVIHSALRRTAVSDVLPQQAVHVIDQVADKMIKLNKDNHSISVKNAMFEVTLALSANLTFGSNFKLEDHVFKKISQTSNLSMTSGSIVVGLVTISSVFKYILWWKWSVVKKHIDFIKNLFIENYETHERAFDGKNRDFTDSLLISKKEAEV